MNFKGAQLAGFGLAFSLALAGCNCGVVANPEGAPCDPGNVCPAGFVCGIDKLCHTTGGTGGGGDNGKCVGVTCNMPPQSTCATAMTLRSYVGVCSPASGLCDYQPMDAQCPKGCVSSGQSGAMCVGGSCDGVVCNTPPDPICKDSTKLTVSTLPGQCNNGTCRYNEQSVDCPSGCMNGACATTGLQFSQVLPRVRHPITAVDQAPGRPGDDVIVVGPNASVSRWNGTQWTSVQPGTMTGNLSSVWFSSTTSAFIVAEGGLFKLGVGGVTRVTGFPTMGTTSKLIDVHGRSESDLIVGDATGTLYRLGPLPSATWATVGPAQRENKVPYAMTGVFMDSQGTPRYFGQCDSPATACVSVYDGTGSSVGWYDDTSTSSARFHACGQSLDATNIPTTVWLGLDTAATRSHAVDGTIGSTSGVVGLDGGAVIGIVGVSGSTLARADFVMTQPDKTIGHLYRVSNNGSTVEHLMEVLYGHQAISKNESAGVIVVDSDTQYGGSTITRRGGAVYDVLDLGAESWVAGAAFDGGSVLMNEFGDVAIRNGAPTFQMRRFPTDLTATDIAAGGNIAVMTAGDGTAWRLPYSGTFAGVALNPKPEALTGVCHASDNEWYLVGKSGSIYAYDGASAHAMTSGTSAALTDVDCPVAGRAVACGPGVVLQLSNGSWAPVQGASPPAGATQCRLLGNAIYIAGPNVFAKWSGGTWSTLAAKAQLDSLVVRSSNEAYAAAGASLMRFDGSAWQAVTAAPQALVAGFSMGARVVYAGNGGVVLEGQ